MRTNLTHGIFIACGTGLAAALSFAYVIYVGRMLGPMAYGEFATGLSFLFFCRVSLSPIHAAVTRLTAQCASLGALDKIRELSDMLVRRISIVAVAVLALAVLLGDSIANLIGLSSVTLLATVLAVVYLTVMCSVPRGVLRGLKRFGNYSISIGLEAILRVIAGILILAWMVNPSPTSAFFAFLVGLLAIYIWTTLQARTVLRNGAATDVDVPTMTMVVPPLFLLMITSGAMQNIDMFLVNILLGPDAAGPYGAAFALTKISGVISTPFVALLLPAIATADNDRSKVVRPLMKTCGGFLLASLVPAVLFAAIPVEIVVTLFGAEFLPGSQLLLGLFVARVCGDLSHIAVLVSVTLDRLSPLVAYLAGLLIEVLAVTFFHASANQIVTILLGAQVITLIAVGFLLVRAHDIFRT